MILASICLLIKICQLLIFNNFFAQLLGAKLAWQILVTNQAGP